MIIFVSGVHGVGKTFLSQLAAERLKLRHAVASQLIREECGRMRWSFDKRVRDVSSNQVALISAVGRMRAAGPALLLDGHFVVRDELGGAVEIEEQVFRAVGVDAVLLLEDRIDVILERLKARGDTSWACEDLRDFAERERNHAERISVALSLPLIALSSPDYEAFSSAVETILSGAGDRVTVR